MGLLSTSDRFLVPASSLQGQRDRYLHLDPLSLCLSRKLETEPELKVALTMLGLKIYPSTGPELLEALATAWTANRVPTERFDVFLGQVREAWQHLDPDKGFPEMLLVRTGQREFSTCGRDELANVYLPDNEDRTRSLLEYEKHILAMHPAAAIRMTKALLTATNIRRASTLEEQFLIDGAHWTGVVDGIPPLDETKYAWLPVIFLTVAAHGGAKTGAETKAWREAANRLRRVHVLKCEAITVQLVDDDCIVASSEPEAQWLPGDVLAIRHDTGLSYMSLAPAAQAMLDRQDLLMTLKVVLRELADQENPTPEQIEAAMEQANIDAQALADVRNRWIGSINLLVDRIRPVLTVLNIPSDGLDAAATDIECLTEWLSSNLRQWPASEVLSAAHCDDRAMGAAAWRAW